MAENVYVCEWCHQFFTPKYRPSKKHKGEKPRFCNTSCSAKWRMSRPEFVKKLTTPKSRQASRENLKKTRARPEVQRMIDEHLHSTSNPFFWPETRAKIHKTLTEQNYSHLRGGNGTGLTEPQALLQRRLKWPAEYAVGVKPWKPGYPRNYKVDLAEPELKLAIEIDGNSHYTKTVKEADRRKEAYLVSIGWQVLRFRNEEILANPDRTVAAVLKAARSITSRRAPATTSPTGS